MQRSSRNGCPIYFYSYSLTLSTSYGNSFLASYKQ